jgi:serine phosphatase RsbU (regulator of sigma subunit)
VVASGGVATLVPVRPGFPIGVQATSAYQEVEVDLGVTDVLVAFTDGLYERRGELVDDGIARVQRQVATRWDEPLDDLVQHLTEALEAAEAPDDTAVLALRLVALTTPAEAPAAPTPV